LPDVPPEIGVRRIGEVGLVPYRCTDIPPTLHHGAFYDVPPALYRGYVTGRITGYTAYRVLPRTYSAPTAGASPRQHPDLGTPSRLPASRPRDPDRDKRRRLA